MKDQVRKWVLAPALAAVCLLGWSSAEASEPIVREEVDCLVVVQEGENSFARVYFIRGGKVLTDRLYSAEMHWSQTGDRFVLTFEDYHFGRVLRIVESKRFMTLRVPDRQAVEGGGEWWDMRKRATDLRAP